jgi:hypothetical protein
VAGVRWQVLGGRWQVAGVRWQVLGGRWQVAGVRWQVLVGLKIRVPMASLCEFTETLICLVLYCSGSIPSSRNR